MIGPCLKVIEVFFNSYKPRLHTKMKNVICPSSYLNKYLVIGQMGVTLYLNQLLLEFLLEKLLIHLHVNICRLLVLF